MESVSPEVGQRPDLGMKKSESWVQKKELQATEDNFQALKSNGDL